MNEKDIIPGSLLADTAARVKAILDEMNDDRLASLRRAAREAEGIFKTVRENMSRVVEESRIRPTSHAEEIIRRLRAADGASSRRVNADTLHNSKTDNQNQ